MTDERTLRSDVIATALAMNAAGINRGKSGNVSARLVRAGCAGFLVTPTGMPYAGLAPEDVVAMTLAGESAGPRAPSSEWRFHRDIYASHPDARLHQSRRL